MRTPNNESLTPTTERTRPGGKSPERKCILTGRHGERDELIRLAISPDGDVLPDPRARAPGRGAWLGVSRDTLETAMEKGKLKGALARAFKSAPPRVPDDLPAQIDAGLLRTLTDRLGLEMRSGHLILGSERIAEHARGGVLSITPAMQVTAAPPSWTRRGVWGWIAKVRARAVRACHWTVRRCLWHWAATMSSIWRSPTKRRQSGSIRP